VVASTVVAGTAVRGAEGPGADVVAGAPLEAGAADRPAPGAACGATAQPTPSKSSATTAAALASDNVFMPLRQPQRA
jgi:hypothetical protein